MLHDKLRAWWWRKQALDGWDRGQKAAAILENTGWARSVGGSAPYLTLWSRGRLGREKVDQAVAASEIHELPSARGCTYVVPARDYALALTLGVVSSEAEMNVARKLGVTDSEIEKLSTDVKKALRDGALAPDGLRQKLGDSIRNLGPEGQKKGVTTTLPLSLGLLQSSGDIRRIPINGRLDQQRYAYALWEPNRFGTSWSYPTLIGVWRNGIFSGQGPPL